MSNFKWMPLACLNLSAANLAAAEKLRKFGFVVNCSEFGLEKYTKVSLGLYDIMANKPDPNILIISSANGVYSWYRVLVTGIGADFKIITGAPSPLVYFNKHGGGMYIVSADTFFKDNVLRQKLKPAFKWDLVVIDEEMNSDVPDYRKYNDNFLWTAERLMINAPVPAKDDGDKTALAELIKSVLGDSEYADNVDKIEFNVSASRMNEDSPVMRYFDAAAYSDEPYRRISFVDYSFDDETMANLRRRVDLRSGLPAYRFCGNVFEQFDCEKFEKEKKIYVKPFFSRSDVEELRNFDKKLNSLLRTCDEMLSQPDCRIMIYCCDKNTLEYLNKALSCVYGSEVRVARDELMRNDDLVRKLSVNSGATAPRIVIGTDALGTAGDGTENITCVINYELPLHPAVLERRMTRHGGAGEADRAFIIFLDSNKVFDSCLLEKVLFTQLGNAYCGMLPTRNILLDLPNKAKSINSLIADLKYTRDFAKQVDNCLDLIKKVKCEYTLPESEKITNSKQLVDFANTMLTRLYTLLGIDENYTEDDIRGAVENLSGLCIIDDGKLVKVPNRAQMAASFEDDGYTNLPFAMDAVMGLADAKNAIDELHKSDNFHLKIKQEINALEDSIQYCVLYGIWKYRAKEQDSNRSFKEYIKIYNDGM